jgi:protein-disulfide isomerase
MQLTATRCRSWSLYVNRMALSRAVLCALALTTLGMLVAGCARRDEPTVATRPDTLSNDASGSSTPMAAPVVPSGQFKMLGDAAAPVRIVEYTDLQCPYCARFARETFPVLRERYIVTGKVRFETVDLPLPMHPYAIPAAVAARCAGQQGRYWEYRERLFDEQNLLGNEPYAQFAADLHLDPVRFAACREDPAQLREVRLEAAGAESLGINSTPTLLIGRAVDGRFRSETVQGAQPVEVYVEQIEALLAK